MPADRAALPHSRAPIVLELAWIKWHRTCTHWPSCCARSRLATGSRLRAVCCIVFVLDWAEAVLLPIAVALLLTFLLNPPVTVLQRWIRRGPAVILVVTLTCGGLAVLGWVLTRQMSSLALELPAISPDHSTESRRRPPDVRGGAVEQVQTHDRRHQARDRRRPGENATAADRRDSGASGMRSACRHGWRPAEPARQRRPGHRARDFHAARAWRDARSAGRRHRLGPHGDDDQGVRRSGDARQPVSVDAVARQSGLRRDDRLRSVLHRHALSDPVGARWARRCASFRISGRGSRPARRS